MVALVSVLLFAAQAISITIPRAASTIRDDLAIVNGDYVKLRQAAQSFDGSLSGSLKIQNALTAADQDTNRTTNDATASAPLAASDVQSILDYINNTLEPNLATAVQAVYNTKDKATAAGTYQGFVNNLARLQKDTDALGKALSNISPLSKQQALKATFDKLHDDFNRKTTTTTTTTTARRHLLSSRNTAQIKADLVRLKNDYSKLQTDANAYATGGSTSSLSWTNDLHTADTDTKTLGNDLASSAAVSSADSQSFIDYLNDPLEPTVKAAMQAVAATKPKFTSTGLSATVCSDLKTLQSDTAAVGNAFAAKAPAAKVQGTKSVWGRIVADIGIAISAYC